MQEPKLNIVPLSVDEVARFWSSFRSARDLAIVGLMLMQGLRSAEVMALNRDDVLLSEGQLRVRGKGTKLRLLPLAPETTQLLDHYLRLERPDPCSAALFVVLKGPGRGTRMTPAGLRSLFRHHRSTTGVQLANPHRFQAHFRFGYGASRDEPARTHAADGALPTSKPRCATCRSRRRTSTCSMPARRRSASILSRGSPRETLAPSSTPASPGASLRAGGRVSVDRTRCLPARVTTTSWFATSSSISEPNIRRLLGLEQLRRDPHILGWMAHLRAQTPPLATATCIGRLFALRTIFHELARTSHLAELADLLLREDIPRSPHTLPRPLTARAGSTLAAGVHAPQRSRRKCLPAAPLRPACVSANASISPMTACAPQDQTNGRFMSLSANSRPSVWSPSMPSSAISFIGCASSALWILDLPMDAFWRVPGSKVALARSTPRLPRFFISYLRECLRGTNGWPSKLVHIDADRSAADNDVEQLGREGELSCSENVTLRT